MEPVSSLPSTVPTASQPAIGDAADPGASGIISSDFETFLKMLTAQLENQDPLNPLESTDFAVQLATFSSVEQQVLTNQRLSDLTAQFGMMGLSQLSSWIGMDVKVAAPAAFSGAPINLVTAPDTSAAKAELVVSDSSGAEVDRFAIPLEGGPISWSGRRPSGSPLPWDTYAFKVISRDGADEITTETVPEVYSQVAEARFHDGEPRLVLAGGTIVSPDDVTGLRPSITTP